MLDGEYILDSLRKLKSSDRGREVFGSDTHGYELNPPAAEKEVVQIEKDFGFTFPDDYRNFIVSVGNGGAGPAYGLFKIGECDSGWDHAKFTECGILDDPSKPFPHSSPWNLPKEFWDQFPDEESMSEEEFDIANEEWNKLLEATYYSGVMNGAVPICHLGCAYREWLIVTGLERGNVWRDDRADEKGIAPLVNPDGSRMTFSNWYSNWLDEALAFLDT